MRRTAFPFLAIVLSAAASCDDRQPLGRDYGEATRHNMSVQPVEAPPARGRSEAPDFSGQRAFGAITRYETDKVKDLIGTSETSDRGRRK